MRIGITGHQNLDDTSRWIWICEAFQSIIAGYRQPYIGYTSLAEGTDQKLADEILKMGGEIHAILPFEDYERVFKNEAARKNYKRLLNESKAVEILQKCGNNEEAFYAAGKRVADLSELIIAVWDGEQAKGLGGTADVVRYALGERKRVIQINPVEGVVINKTA